VSDPKFLNLDELPATESDIKIQHKGKSHAMAVLTVDAFVAQQRRAKDHAKIIEKSSDVGDDDMLRSVEIMRDAIHEFFPTLPVGELPTDKLFRIFAWLNEMSSAVNEAGATSAEGNGEGETA